LNSIAIKFGFHNSEVCKTRSRIQECEVVIKSVVRAIELREVVMAIEKLKGFAVEKTCVITYVMTSDLVISQRKNLI